MDLLAVVVPVAVFVVIFAAMLPAARSKEARRGGTSAGFRNQLVMIAVMVVLVFSLIFAGVTGTPLALGLAAILMVFVAAAVWNERNYGPQRRDR